MYMFSIQTNVSSFKWLWSEIFVYVQNERSSQPPAIPLHTKQHFIIRYSASTASVPVRFHPTHTCIYDIELKMIPHHGNTTMCQM